MARHNREKRIYSPVKPRIHWLTWLNTALIIGLYAWILLEKYEWLGLRNF